MQSTSSSDFTILCVDDEENILSSLKRMLGLNGYKVFTANSGAHGLEILPNNSIDIIISDMRMPEMNGVQFLKNAREILPLSINILLTGYSDLNEAIAAVNEGGIYRYLNKPWNENELLETLRSSTEIITLRKDKQNLLELTIKQNHDLNDLVVNLESKVKERTYDISNANLKLRESYVSSIKAFANFIELRNKKLFDHSKRVADLSLKLTKKLNLSDEDSQSIFIGGLLHDIGKIGLNDRLLSTKIIELPFGDLDAYKEHPIVGSLCLKGLDDLEYIVDIIKHHHERFDGNGFPDQLKGNNISIGSRIVGLAETYFELIEGDITSVPKSQNEAVQLILKYSHSAFCPTVVKAFSEVFTSQTSQISNNSSSNLTFNNAIKNISPSIEVNDNSSPVSKKSGTNPTKNLFTYQVLQSVVGKYSHALIKDERDKPEGFLWVVSSVKKYGDNPELDNWLKKNKFIYSENEAAWYFPYD